jgi:serine/threonine protein kinase
MRAHVGRTALDALLRLTSQDDRLSLVKAVAASITKVLDYVHGKDVVHLDIRPANIIVSAAPDLVVQMIDWGCAARAMACLQRIAAGTVCVG